MTELQAYLRSNVTLQGCYALSHIVCSPQQSCEIEYIEPRQYGSGISADYQQKLLLTKHDTSWGFLLVTFLEKQKRE